MTVSISLKSIFLTLSIVLVVGMAWYLRTLVLSLLLSYILMAGFRPFIQKVEKSFGLGYKTASALTYFSSAIVFLILLGAFFGPFVSQSQTFVQNFPNLLGQLFLYFENLGIQVTPSQIQQVFAPSFNQMIASLVDLTVGSISLLLFVVSVFVITFYLVLEHDKAVNFFAKFFPEQEEKIISLEKEIERRVGVWVVGQISIAFIVAIITLVGLFVFRVNYFVPLSLLAFFLNPITGIGPVIAMIPAVVIASVQSPWLGLWVFVFYNIIQTIKENFVVPNVMGSRVGLNPFVILFVLLIGASLFGFLGIIVSVPAAVGVGVVIEDLMEGKNE